VPICEATKTNGEPCRANAVKGETRCSHHRGVKIGAQPKLTPELADRLVALLQAGNYVTIAAREVGISRTLFYDWLARGQSHERVDRPYRELRERVENALAQAEARHVAAISAAARTNWQASAWWLERMYPDRWGKTSVRLRDEAPAEPTVAPPDEDDPFREVDELAERRRRAAG